MTRLITCGFELSNMSVETDISNCSTASDYKRSGNYSAYANQDNEKVEWYFTDPTLLEIYVGFAVRISRSQTSYYDIFRIYGDGGLEASLQVRSDIEKGQLSINGVATSDPTEALFSYGDWVYVQLHYKMDDAAGDFTMKIGGNVVAQITGDTNVASTYIDYVSFNSTSLFLHYDDIVINDTNGTENNYWTGSPRLILATPNGAGSNTEWTPIAGANYECVDEIPVTTNEYVYTQATGTALDTYNITDPLAGTEVINNVILNTIGNIDTGTGTFRPAIYVNSSVYYGMTGTLYEASKLYQTVWNNNPDDSAMWEPTDIDDLEIGQETP